MIAGLSYAETRVTRPGAMLDLFVLRRSYDDEQHGIKRVKKDDHDISAEDEAQFEEGSGDGGTGDQDHTGG